VGFGELLDEFAEATTKLAAAEAQAAAEAEAQAAATAAAEQEKFAAWQATNTTRYASALLAETAMAQGIIRTGKSPAHQDLHIDDSSLLGPEKSPLLRRMHTNPSSVAPEDWLKTGYVIDLPLSREGSWVRIAVPIPGTKAFKLILVFIPFGSCLIRSASVFHSGHYGLPGNTRFHATLFIKGHTRMNTRVLGYLRDHLDKESGFLGEKWKLFWAGDNSYAAEDVHLLKKWPALKKQGTVYFQDFGELEYDQLDMHMWLLNPSDNYFKIPKKLSLMGNDDDDDDEEDDFEPIPYRNPLSGRVVDKSIPILQPGKLHPPIHPSVISDGSRNNSPQGLDPSFV
jgi:hypothetical protein